MLLPRGNSADLSLITRARLLMIVNLNKNVPGSKGGEFNCASALIHKNLLLFLFFFLVFLFFNDLAYLHNPIAKPDRNENFTPWRTGDANVRENVRASPLPPPQVVLRKRKLSFPSRELFIGKFPLGIFSFSCRRIRSSRGDRAVELPEIGHGA